MVKSTSTHPLLDFSANLIMVAICRCGPFDRQGWFRQRSPGRWLPYRIGELYMSEAFIEAHNKLQEQAPEPGCNLPRVVLGLMFASDGVQLTSFSTAKLWPAYLTIGNESKYRRSKPSCQAFEHIAYLETASETFCVEFYIANFCWCR